MICAALLGWLDDLLWFSGRAGHCVNCALATSANPPPGTARARLHAAQAYFWLNLHCRGRYRIERHAWDAYSVHFSRAEDAAQFRIACTRRRKLFHYRYGSSYGF